MTDQPVSAARPRRPLGVLIIAATQLLRAVLIVGQFVEPTPGSLSHTLVRIIGIGLAAASIAVVAGLLTNRRWGWVGAIVLSGLSLAFAIGAWWEGRPVFLNMAIN